MTIPVMTTGGQEIGSLTLTPEAADVLAALAHDGKPLRIAFDTVKVNGQKLNLMRAAITEFPTPV